MRNVIRAAAVAVTILIVAAAPAPADAFRHLRLVRAEPAVDGTVDTAPAEIRLWFSQEPRMRGTTVRLIAEDDSLIEMGEPAQDAQDGQLVRTAVKGAVRPGAYTVNWRTTARDGHVIRGDFRFTYRPARASD